MKPQQLCKLTKGKLVDTFDGFVDTFNWLVDFCNNLKGDAQINNTGNITVDVSVPDSPVIRGDGKGGEGVEIDNVSIKENTNDEIELAGFASKATETNGTIASLMTVDDSIAENRSVVERYSNTPEIDYRGFGKFIAGDDTNLVFTKDANGNIKIDLYYS